MCEMFLLEESCAPFLPYTNPLIFADITYLQLATKKILENTTAGTEAVKTMELLLKDPESAEMIAMINYVKDLDINVEAESIDEDPNWFEDVPGKLKTKEAVMKRIARERVRSYLNTSKDFINNAVCSNLWVSLASTGKGTKLVLS